MADDTGRPGRSGDEQHNPWAPPRDGVAPGRGSMDHSEEDRKRRSVAEQPTITSGSGAVPPPVPPPVPPAPGAGPGAGPGAAAGGPGGGPGSGYAASPYGAPSPYGQQHQQQQQYPHPPQQPQAPQPYAGSGAAYGYPNPAPQPYGYGAGPGPVGYGWHGPPQQPGGKAVAAMVLGIIGLLTVSTCWGSFLGIFLSPVALGLGLSAKRAADRGEAGGRGQAVAGFVMGIIGTVLSVLLVAFLVVMLTAYNEEFGEYDSDPGSGDGSSLDARERAVVLVLPGAGAATGGIGGGAADRGA
ncbi:DUF4190 domain-containing protein [Streptomyces sp. HNM0575]|uniref:DUF4190 domain-containing protein n=1 Tax=Streptomyces sp. HNM0575 TaxID=2716338 RepID=UPI00145D5F80|nr:DUF4190 domain-containing protein [Streptomyces sp. HNM0575]NLU76491.1 DUF4190 domain-containing protein [Streptomyces sp. HNM0575]